MTALLFLVLMMGTSFADEVTDCDKAQAIREGSTAKCDGVVFPGELAKDYVELRDVALPACRIELDASNQIVELLKQPAPVATMRTNTIVWVAVGFVAGITAGVALVKQ